MLFSLIAAAVTAMAANPPATQPAFMQAKTWFQTNVAYDPRLAMAVDGVVVHQHGTGPKALGPMLRSWQDKGYTVGRMFFSDSDATTAYWKGQADGRPHDDEVERDAAGNVVLCAGIRPYMLPTEGWIRHLEEMTAMSIDVGAQAIMPEEPLAHVFSGYEKAFAPLWKERYGTEWEPENSSPRAHILTAQLKGELYAKLEGRLAALTADRARQLGRDIPFILPVHALYSNLASRLAAPLGTSLDIKNVDGYVGQVWTGPINWVLANYGSSNKSFFASAYALYDYFVALADGTGRKLWLLTDPVEDDPNHTWPEFQRWYRECVVAEMLFPRADHYEVMPWPDRIFLPGYHMGGGTPAPEAFRINVLSALQAQQEMPPAGDWMGGSGAVSTGIGVAVADSMMWLPDWKATIQNTFGMLMPLIQAGVPVSACILERAAEPNYLNRFKTIVLCYDVCLPPSPAAHESIAKWVRGGGSLVVLGRAQKFSGPFWWVKSGKEVPLAHLLELLDAPLLDRDGQTRAAGGTVFRRVIAPGEFGDTARAEAVYFPLLESALKAAGCSTGLQRPGSFCLRRGPFIVAHAATSEVRLGPVVDLFDPEFPLRDSVTLKPGESGLYRVANLAATEPALLHCTHRLMTAQYKNGVTRVVLRGPAETPAVTRFYTAGFKPAEITARDAAGRPLKVDVREDGPTLRASFPNEPAGATLEIRWARRN